MRADRDRDAAMAPRPPVEAELAAAAPGHIEAANPAGPSGGPRSSNGSVAGHSPAAATHRTLSIDIDMLPASGAPSELDEDRTDPNRGVRIVIAGELNIAEAWRVRELDVADLPTPVVIDLSRVVALDVAGVAAVTGIARQLMAVGAPVHVVAPQSPSARRTSDMTGVFPLVNEQSLPTIR